MTSTEGPALKSGIWCRCSHRRRYHDDDGGCRVNVGTVGVTGWGPTVSDRTCPCVRFVEQSAEERAAMYGDDDDE